MDGLEIHMTTGKDKLRIHIINHKNGDFIEAVIPLEIKGEKDVQKIPKHRE